MGMPFFLVNSTNTELVKGEPLSETIIDGMPCVANKVCKCSTVLKEVAAFTTCASIHLEYASTVIKNICLEMVPRNLCVAWSMDVVAIPKGEGVPLLVISG